MSENTPQQVFVGTVEEEGYSTLVVGVYATREAAQGALEKSYQAWNRGKTLAWEEEEEGAYVAFAPLAQYIVRRHAVMA